MWIPAITGRVFSFLQRTGPGLLSVLWPRLASIQGLHLHQSDTKPHGPPKIASPQEEVIVTDLCYLKRKMPEKHFTWYLVQVFFDTLTLFNAAERCRTATGLDFMLYILPSLRFSQWILFFWGGGSFTNWYSSRPKDSIILEIQRELLFCNRPRLISAWHKGCNILKFQPWEPHRPATLTVGADDLLFSVMKELTFSYLESPAGLRRRASKSEVCSQGFFLSYQELKRLSLFFLFCILSETFGCL